MLGSGTRTDDEPRQDDRPRRQSVGKHSKVWRHALLCSLRSLQGFMASCTLCKAGRHGVQQVLWVSLGLAERVG